MVAYILKRLWYGFLVMAGVVVVVFILFHAIPGDPVAMMAGQRSDLATRQAIAEELGLNLPMPQQFARYINDLSPLSIHSNTPLIEEKYKAKRILSVGSSKVLVIKKPYLRRSFQTNKRVDEIIAKNVASTFWLALSAIVFATVIGVLFGVISAIKQNGFWDHLLVSLSVVGISIPSFVAAIIMALIFGYYLSAYTGLNITGQLWVNNPLGGRELHLENLILPAITLGIRPLAIITQLTRSAMLEVLSKDYIRTAKAKGLSYSKVIFKHALKNSMNPVITAVSGWLASLMAGAFFVEYIFDWKGLGYLTIKSVQSLDFPVVMGATLFIAVVFVLINIFVDILYAAIDPRVRLY